MTNPVCHFEIPVADMDRAIEFYQRVFGFELNRQMVDGYEMAFFPRSDDQAGLSGALAKGDVYKPSQTGCILYFAVDDIDEALRRSESEGAKLLYPKTDIGDGGYVAEIEDSEGNRIAINAAKPL
ncbi:VOC family protein [Roseibium sp. RKSG952]|uniref:VOC family protein n=1 Tax=Roseibium sp. RKSG952 TaxID=2529384 RepID=UPI0012BC592F|nr:VOC family protein [Roseibium sp. RKSG952]MTI03376.1 VOC family protein [Roseibium sp. RKSG952]